MLAYCQIFGKYDAYLERVLYICNQNLSIPALHNKIAAFILHQIIKTIIITHDGLVIHSLLLFTWLQQQFRLMGRKFTNDRESPPLQLSIFLVIAILLIVPGTKCWCFDTEITQFSSAAEIDFSNDNLTFLAVDSSNKLVNFWRMDTKELVLSYSVSPNTPNSAKFSKDGSIVGIGMQNGDILLLNTNNNWAYTVNNTIGNPAGAIVQIDFSWNLNAFIVCSNNKIMLLNYAGNSNWTINGNSGITSCKLNKADGVGLSYSKTIAWYLYGQSSTVASDTKSGSGSQNYIDVDFSLENANATAMRLLGGNGDNNVYPLTNGMTSSNSQTYSVSNSPTVCYSKDNNFFAVGDSGSGSGAKFHIINATGRADYAFTIFNDATNIKHCRFNYNTKYLAASSGNSGSIYIYTMNCFPNKCQSGYYSSGDLCLTCSSMAGCLACSDSSTCTSCGQGFYLNSNACSTCTTITTGCRSCENSTKCTQCQQGYFLNYTSYTCVLCENSIKGCISCWRNSTNTTVFCRSCLLQFYLNSTDSKCYSCATNNPKCMRCFNSSFCLQCQMGYYSDANSVCQLCSANCLTCTNSSNCLVCKKGYYSSSGTCTICGTNCLDCDNSSTCISCARGTSLISGSCTPCTSPCVTCSTSATYCLTCSVGFYPNGAGSCPKCINNCVNCFTGTNCTSCQSGYYVTATSTCSACSSIFTNCTLCNSNQCLACQSSFYLNSSNNCQNCLSSLNGCLACNNSTNCSQCFVGYYLNSGSCTACPSQCQSCINSTSCLNCAVGYYLATTTCTMCPSPCVTCNSSANCLSCQTGYYLNTSAFPNVCAKCLLSLIGCVSCSSSTTCIQCQLGRYISGGNCPFCPSNCSTCNSTTCLSCSVGYYLTGSTCSKCQQNCSECSTATACSSCNTGFYLNTSLASNNCLSCTGLGCETCNINGCLSCQIGYYLSSLACLTCNSSFTNCFACSESKCLQCLYGFYSNSTGICNLCVSALNGCASCINNTVCGQCTAGYYLTATFSCTSCPVQCKTCFNNVCTTCQMQYTFNAGNTDCLLCESYMDACLTCSSNNVCTSCYQGFYLSSNACASCRSNMIGCLSCFNSSTCAICQDQYYLVNGVCTNCNSIQACEYCQNSTTCISCLSGYYLNINNTCSQCTASLVGCLFCASSATCRLCQTGYYLNAGTNQCQLCVNNLQGCLSCTNSTTCTQCDGGYYLDSATLQCKSCNVVGCQVCGDTSPGVCISCSFGYFLTGATCTACSQNSCLECSGVATCLRCDSGYYLSGSTCSSCKPTLTGCSKCVNSTVCTQCDSSYYLDPATNQCLQCASTLDSCMICSSSTYCTACSAGYFSQSGICTSCSLISGCFMCISAASCQSCVNGYYLAGITCTACSSSLSNCYQCTNSTVCLSCTSGYVLDSSGVCNVVTAGTSTAPVPIPYLQVKTAYVSSSMLKHTLYTKQGYSFTKQSLTWSSVTTISLYNSATSSTIALTISSVEWGPGMTSIIYYTNNPLNLNADALSMPFARLLLTQEDISFSYQTKFQLTQQALALLMPDQIIPNDFTQQKPLMEPAFYMSYLQNSGQFIYSIIGFAIVGVLFISFFVRAACTASNTRNIGEIVPHILALKTCTLMVFPIYPQIASFCYGLMAVDLPWLSQYYTSILAYAGDIEPAGFQLFFTNMNFASMHLSTYVLCLLLLLLGYLSISRPIKRQDEVFSLLHEEEMDNSGSYAYLRFIFMFFSFGITFAGAASIQGALYNPADYISINGVFYILGSVILCIQLAVTIYLTKKQSRSCYLRSFVKAILLSVAHISPVYICTLSVALDIAIVIIEYQRHKDQIKFPKVWVLKHILVNLSLLLIYYLNSKKIVLLTVIAISFLSIIIELGQHISEGNTEDFTSKRVKPVGSDPSDLQDEKNDTVQYFAGDLKIHHGKEAELVEPALGDTKTTFKNSKGFAPDFIFDDEDHDRDSHSFEKTKSPRPAEKRHRPFRTLQRKKQIKIEPIIEKDDSSRNE